ncbi:MAG: lysylphosphatidylglycerol synthase transmembrane domain-containing protein [Dehalococcoidia bacterium]|nr:lysylphosphatidylglycerol synthase transmembrane domain-containing protein [Dehalococcoidia bacterium]
MAVFIRILVSLAGLGIVVWVLQGIDLEETGRAVLTAQVPYLALGVLLVAASVFSRTLRWKYMLAPRRIVPLGELFGPLTIGYAVGNVTATGLGAIPRSLLVTRKSGVPASFVLGTVLLEFVLDAAVVVSWAAVASFVVDLPSALAPMRYVLSVGAACIYLVILAFRRRSSLLTRILPVERIAPLVSRLPAEWLEGWDGFQDGASAFLNSPSIFLKVAVLTLWIWVIEALMFWVLMLAAGLDASLAQGSFVMAFTHTVIGVPSLPGFVGTLDAVALISLGAMGIVGARAFSYTLIVHAFLIVPLTVAGGLMAWREGISLNWGRSKKELAEHPESFKS